MIEEYISQLEDRVMEITEVENLKKKKRIKRRDSKLFTKCEVMGSKLESGVLLGSKGL